QVKSASINLNDLWLETKLPLTKDEEAFDVDVHLYRSMIGNSKDFSSQCCQEDLQVSQGQTKLGLMVSYEKLTPKTKHSIKPVLLNFITKEKVKSILKKLCDTVSELAASLVLKGKWDELLPFMFECVLSDDLFLQDSVLLIFAQLAQFIGESLVAYISNLHGVFVRCLASGSVDVRIAALSGVVNFVQCLGVSDQDRFQDDKM
ncbi:importin-5-like protein, partial [Tanacetum coccineum]